MPCLLLPLQSVLPEWSSDPASCAKTASISSKWRSSLCVRFSLPLSSRTASDVQSGTCEVHSRRRDRFGLTLHIASATPELHKPFVDALDNLQKTYVAAKDIGCGSPPSSGSLILRNLTAALGPCGDIARVFARRPCGRLKLPSTSPDSPAA